MSEVNLKSMLDEAVKTGKALRNSGGDKVLLFADTRTFGCEDRYGFHYFGGYVFHNEFIHAVYNEEGHCANSNVFGDIVAWWEDENE
ncbi:hypothetical protein Q7381_01370 [Glaesserella parasuis]|nr:hypothetical protein [Glaesserella parasuis]MDP0119040.1 hypothetical protein [Glaesserella parasuis]